MGILHFISIVFCAQPACRSLHSTRPGSTKSLAEENDFLCQALGLALCSLSPLSLLPPSESIPQPYGCSSVHELMSCTHPRVLKLRAVSLELLPVLLFVWEWETGSSCGIAQPVQFLTLVLVRMGSPSSELFLLPGARFQELSLPSTAPAQLCPGSEPQGWQGGC